MSLNQVLGHPEVVEMLKKELKLKKFKHSYVFFGTKGVGKKYTAVQFAKSIMCTNKIEYESCDKCEICMKIEQNLFPDLYIIDFEYQANLLNEKIDLQKSIKIDTIREIKRISYLTSYNSEYKIFIIDNFDTIQKEASNSILKVIEEPPKNVLFILIANNLGYLPKTILSRCELITFKPLSIDTIKKIFLKEEIYSEINYKYLYGSLNNIDFLSKLSDVIDFKKFPMFDYHEIPNISDKLSKNKDLSKYFMCILIDQIIRKSKNMESLQLIYDLFIDYFFQLKYNIDIKLLLDSFLFNLRSLMG